jgi:hypothetical protein
MAKFQLLSQLRVQLTAPNRIPRPSQKFSTLLLDSEGDDWIDFGGAPSRQITGQGSDREQ